jgi:hypothetical protein
VNRIVRIGAAVVATALFAWSFGAAEPYPSRHDVVIFFSAATLFALILVTRPPEATRAWCLFGVATFLCWLVPFTWYWVGSWRFGWWYPPHPHILRHFVLVDGEAAYDAEVSDVFLVLWLAVALTWGLRHLTIGWSGRER